jgi:hypothetical protein
MTKVHIFATWTRRPWRLESVLVDATIAGLVSQIESAIVRKADVVFETCAEEIRESLEDIRQETPFSNIEFDFHRWWYKRLCGFELEEIPRIVEGYFALKFQNM